MPEATKPTPNKKLRHERERRCWSQQELADQLGTTPLNVGRWERGVTMPGPHFRQKLCEVFEKSPQELGLVPHSADTGQTSETLPEVPIVSATSSTQAVPPPTLWNVPYRRNPFFTGREDILIHLRETLTAEEQPVALTQTQAISGLGGVGKTQTAIEYAYRYRDSYSTVFWAKADSYDLLVSDYITIAILLHLPERNEQDQSKIVNAVIRWFDSHKNWLLILDNADNLQVVEEFIPSAGKGHMLLTTRAYSTGTIAQRIELEKMGVDEGTFFLLRRTKRLKGATLLAMVPVSVREQAQAIVEAVDGLPLALDQAGAYIEETGCDLTDYLKFYKTRRNRLLRTRGRDASGHPEPVAATWSLSFEKVERANPAAAELLRLCAFLHPDAIPEAMIMQGASELGPVLQTVAEDELDLNEAIAELRKYSLVRRDPELKLLNLHRLVQAVLKDGMDKETQQAWAGRTVNMVNKAFPEAEAPMWPTCQQYLPHAQTCAALIEQWGIQTPENTQLLNRAGNYLRQRAQHTIAERLLKQALTLRQQTLGPEHPHVATTLNDLALLYYHQSSFEQAEPFYVQAISIREKQLGPEHPQLADSLHNLAALYDVQGKYTEAGSLYRRALLIRENALGPEHPGIARILTDLSWHYVELGKYDAAEPLAQRALAISEKAHGPVHPDVAYALNSLAWLYYTQDIYSLAEQPLQRALEINEQLLGSDHPEVAISVNNLAKVYYKQKKYAQVESLFQRALTTLEQAWGREHPDVAQCLQNLAELYREQGRYAEAEAFYLEAVTVGEKTIGAEHPHVARYYNNLASLYTAQGRYAEAEPLFQRALSIREQKLGAEHPEVANTLEYTTLLRKIGREDEAATLEARAQAIRAKNAH